MRCRQAKHRLNEANFAESKLLDDAELLSHIRSCPSCMKQKELSDILNKVFTSGIDIDRDSMLPLNEQRNLVDRRIASRISRTSMRIFQLKDIRRPALRIGIITAFLMLLFFTPFNYYNVVGYEVTLEGIDRNFAEDGETACDVLYALGLEDAAIDLPGCNKTCSLIILDLKSREEVNTVIDAFTKLSKGKLTADIIPIRIAMFGNLLDRAGEQSDI